MHRRQMRNRHAMPSRRTPTGARGRRCAQFLPACPSHLPFSRIMAGSPRKRLRGESPTAITSSTRSSVTSHPSSPPSCVFKRPRTSPASSFGPRLPPSSTSNARRVPDPKKPAYTDQDDQVLCTMRASELGDKPWSDGIEIFVWKAGKWAICSKARGCGLELKYFGALRDYCLDRFNDNDLADDLLTDLIQNWQGKLAKG